MDDVSTKIVGLARDINTRIQISTLDETCMTIYVSKAIPSSVFNTTVKTAHQ